MKRKAAYTTVWVPWNAHFRCFWVTLSCLPTSVFVEKPKNLLKNLGFYSPGWHSLRYYMNITFCSMNRHFYILVTATPHNQIPKITKTRVSAAADTPAWRRCSAHAKYSVSHHMVIKPFLLLHLDAEYRSEISTVDVINSCTTTIKSLWHSPAN